MEVPGDFIKAAGAPVAAAGYNQAGADTKPVGNIILFDFSVVHNDLNLLQVHYPLADFLGPALVPELGADVAAGTSGYIHLILVTVSAVGAFPDQLFMLVLDNLNFSVISAYLAVIALGI